MVKNSAILANSNSTSFEHTFSESGKYRINFVAYDNLTSDHDSDKAEKEITVEKSVTGLFLSTNGSRTVNKSVGFVLLWKTVGESTEFEVDFSDGSSSKQELSPSRDSTTKKFTAYKLPFDPEGFEGIIFTHIFTEIGDRLVTVTENTTEQKVKTSVSIAKEPCPLPEIIVTGGDKNAALAPEIPYEIQYTLFSAVKVECDAEIKIDFNWRIFKADEYLLKTTGSSSIPPDDNREVK